MMAQTSNRQRAAERRAADAQSDLPEEPVAATNADDIPADLIESTDPSAGHVVRYVGQAHVCSLSTTDLIALGVPTEYAEPVTFDRRRDTTIVVNGPTYNALIALKDWQG